MVHALNRELVEETFASSLLVCAEKIEMAFQKLNRMKENIEASGMINCCNIYLLMKIMRNMP